MRWLPKSIALLGLGFFVLGSLTFAQSDKPAETQAGLASQAATEEELAQLRREVPQGSRALSHDSD